MNTTVTLPEQLFSQIARRAEKYKLSPEQFIVDYLRDEFIPRHPYVEIVYGAGGPLPVLRGTHTGVISVVGYVQAGYSPQEIANDILPHLTLAAIYDALSYYEDHRTEMDKQIKENTPEVWRARLIDEMGTEAAKKFLGEA